MNKLILFSCLVLMCGLASAKIYSRCELASTLLRSGIPRNQLNDWVCLAEGESGRNTAAINKKNKNGSWDYGIFQINSMYWCQGPKMKSNECKVNCNAFLTNSITTDIACAKKIYRRHNFSAWYAWRSKCKGRSISQYTAGCKL